MRLLFLVSCVALFASSAVGSASPGEVRLPRASFRAGEDVSVQAELPPGLHEMELLLVAGEFRLRLTKELDPREPLVLFRVPDFPVRGARFVIRASGAGLDEADVATSSPFDIEEGPSVWPAGPRLHTGPKGLGTEWWIGDDAPPEDHLAPDASASEVPTVSGRRRHPAVVARRASRWVPVPILSSIVSADLDGAQPSPCRGARNVLQTAHVAAPVPLRI